MSNKLEVEEKIRQDFIVRKSILIIAYNRPTKVRELILILRKFKTSNILFFIDGPKNNFEDRLKVDLVKKELLSIDWKCDLLIFESEKNLGVKNAVSAAISWAFEHCEELIILEDDIIPNSTFFMFMHEALDEYKNDNRILGITGFNRIEDRHNCKFDKDLILSRYPVIWGWATWKDRWQRYNKNILNEKINYVKILQANNFNFLVVAYFLYNFFKVRSSDLDTWDYQLSYLAFLQGTYFIIPRKNLIKNIGMDIDATHTKTKLNYPDPGDLNFEIPKEINYMKLYDIIYRKTLIKELLNLFLRKFISNYRVSEHKD